MLVWFHFTEDLLQSFLDSLNGSPSEPLFCEAKPLCVCAAYYNLFEAWAFFGHNIHGFTVLGGLKCWRMQMILTPKIVDTLEQFVSILNVLMNNNHSYHQKFMSGVLFMVVYTNLLHWD